MIKNKKTKFFVIIIGFIIIVASILIFLNKRNDNQNTTNTTDSTRKNDGYNIDYSPPTDQEKASGDNIKKEIENQNNDQEKTSNAEVVISDASQYGDIVEVRAFVNNIVSNGSCKITFTKDGQTVTKTVDALADASTSQCKTLSLNSKDFTIKGEWGISVEFNSDKGSGVKSTNISIK
jgi:hypothetical protein